MRSTIEKLVASPVPVVTYWRSGARAASAGFFILEAGDVADGAGTATGAAHPVLMGGEMDAVMKQKVENDAAAYLRSITGRRGRNSALAETAVRESKSFTEREALDQKLIDLVAPDERRLMTELDGRTVTRLDGTPHPAHRGCGDHRLRAFPARAHHGRHCRPEYCAGAAGAGSRSASTWNSRRRG